MKKRTLMAVFFLLLMMVGGCGKPAPATQVYLIPTSYWQYSGSTPEAAAESMLRLGEDYVTAARVVSDGVELDLTEAQRDNLIRRNNDYHDSILSSFMSYSSDYRYDPDPTYQQVTLYFDEKLPPAVNIKTVFMLTAGYGMNYILQNNTTDWNVELRIYNCHTGKLVCSFNAPSEEASCGPEEWEASYAE